MQLPHGPRELGLDRRDLDVEERQLHRGDSFRKLFQDVQPSATLARSHDPGYRPAYSDESLAAALRLTVAFRGIEASSTTNVGADIYAFSRAVGLFGGGALEGAKLFTRQDWNTEYYGAAATPRAVVIDRQFFNPHAEKLRDALPKSGT